MESLIITLDGPAGSGKSTVAKRLAQRLGLEFLDTGAMYRGLCAQCLDAGIDPATQPQRAAELAQKTDMRFDWQHEDDGAPRLFVGEREVTDRLRDGDVTATVSDLAAIAAVRQVLVEQQRRIARQHPRLVTEGRDQGSVVFPQAQVKFYLDATAAVRAQRRARQLREMGRQADEQAILAAITQRDHKDSNRRDGPLICPADALRIDTSAMALDQVIDHLEGIVRDRVGKSLEQPLAPQKRGGAR